MRQYPGIQFCSFHARVNIKTIAIYISIHCMYNVNAHKCP
jgi:hypothetical protein